MSLLGGIGYAAGKLADKYIDQDIELQRQKAIADNQIAVHSATAAINDQFDQAKEERAFKNLTDPVRQAAIRQNKLDELNALKDAERSNTIKDAEDPNYVDSIKTLDMAKNAYLASRDGPEDQFKDRELGLRSRQLDIQENEAKRSLLSNNSKYNKDQAETILKTNDDLKKLLDDEKDPSRKAMYQQAIDNNLAKIQALNNFGFEDSSPSAKVKVGSDVKSNVNAYSDVINQAASAEGIDPLIIKGLMTVESGGKHDSTSPTGVKGLMQITGATAKRLGITDPNDPNQQVAGAAKYLGQLSKMFEDSGDPRFAIQSYNSGEGTVDLARKMAQQSGDDPNDFDIVRDKYLKAAYTQLVPKGMYDGKYADKVLSASKAYTGKADIEVAEVKEQKPSLLAISNNERKEAKKVEDSLVKDMTSGDEIKDNPSERLKLFRDAFERTGDANNAKTLALAVTFAQDGTPVYNGQPFKFISDNDNSLDKAIEKNSSKSKDTNSSNDVAGSKSLLTADSGNIDSSFVKQMLKEKIDSEMESLRASQGQAYRDGNKNKTIRKLEELMNGLNRIDPNDENIKGTEAYKRKVLSEIS